VRLTHRSAIALYVVTFVAAVITLVDSGPVRAESSEWGHPMRTVPAVTADGDLAAPSTT
jgi:hypothetical protein